MNKNMAHISLFPCYISRHMEKHQVEETGNAKRPNPSQYVTHIINILTSRLKKRVQITPGSWQKVS